MSKVTRMNAESNNIQDYLKKSEVINYDHKLIVNKCLELKKEMEGMEKREGMEKMGGTEEKDEISLIRRIYEFVRDDIDHSGDIGAQEVTCKASEVLEIGHGICCAKSHLLAAMLRYFGIPTGFCYQKLCSGQEGLNRKVLHGLNAVYLKDLNKWVRLDARGNKPGVDAQFSIHEEKIAWQANKERGEEDHPVIFKEPNPVVVEVLKKSNTRKEMWAQWDLGLKDVFRD
ncbi:transglutaminase family protein [Methanosarcina sp.]|jgi:transglutaminase-like putative cysteine protease|uniref:transglutaminase-like domain-containing protein n=1 Tax=Methanosarcina sp. TaxID=2213 RepID=UPI002CFCE1AB|nr:transglutaminase family protein [Methanosarcina sp.]HOW15189.1 transglutaminase family protein [Methanosarcina sp.]